MREKIELLQVTSEPCEGVMVLAESERIAGYYYVITPDAYAIAKGLFGEEGESDEALGEDPSGWLAQLLDCEAFEDAEEKIVSYFGSEQGVVSALSGVAASSAFSGVTESAVTDIQPIDGFTANDVADDETLDIELMQLLGVVDDANEESVENAQQVEPADEAVADSIEDTQQTDEGSTITETLAFLDTLDNVAVQRLLLRVLSQCISRAGNSLLSDVYTALVAGLRTVSKTLPEETETLLVEFIKLTIEETEGGQ